MAKYYRAFGPGYSQLINRVLATYAQMKIAEVKLNDRRAERYLQWERDEILRESQGRPGLPPRPRPSRSRSCRRRNGRCWCGGEG